MKTLSFGGGFLKKKKKREIETEHNFEKFEWIFSPRYSQSNSNVKVPMPEDLTESNK
jgi:hypothetical protein